jgi:hypothetical protein
LPFAGLFHADDRIHALPAKSEQSDRSDIPLLFPDNSSEYCRQFRLPVELLYIAGWLTGAEFHCSLLASLVW